MRRYPTHLPILAPLGVALAWALACGGGGEVEQPVTEDEPEPSAESGALARVQRRGQLVVGMDMGPDGSGTPPMYFPDAAGKPDGFDYTVARWVATAAGVPDVRLIHAPYSQLPELLRASNEVDVVISGYVPSDTPGISWSVSYLDFGLCLVVRADSGIKGVADLEGRDIGMFADEAVRPMVKQLVPRARSLTEMEDGYWDALYEGRLQGFFYDYPYAAAELRVYGEEHPDRAKVFRFAAYNLSNMHYAVAVREGEDELLDVVNTGITRFWESDEYGSAIRRYLSGGAAVPVAQAETGTPSKGGTPVSARIVKVAKGDTLSLIAGRELGDSKRWKEIWELNKGRLPNPHLIEVGDELALPAA